MNQIHEIRLQILKKLIFAKQLRYTDLKTFPEMENNQLDFHLDKLVSEGLVGKSEKAYFLTTKGKEYSGRIDTDKVQLTKQAKLTAWVCCTRYYKGKTQYLIGTRLKQPFFGCQGFVAGKVNFGETIIEAAKRELSEETGLIGKPKIASLKHFHIYDQDNNLVDDKLMFLCVVKNPTGNLIRKTNESENCWVNKADLKRYLTYPFEPIDEFLSFVKEVENFSNQKTILEIKHYTEKF